MRSNIVIENSNEKIIANQTNQSNLRNSFGNSNGNISNKFNSSNNGIKSKLGSVETYPILKENQAMTKKSIAGS